MARKYPEGFYVYLHRRKSDGLVFYVGKGKGKRAWVLSDIDRKNDHWTKTKNKHGIYVEIVKSGMTEVCAFTLKRILIHQLRKAGMPLTNMTNGGEGVSGFVSSKRIPVYCSNGMYFESMVDASVWLRKNGWPDANSSCISSASLGVKGTAYGYSWWREGDKPKVYVDHYKDRARSLRKKVYCSNGMNFEHARLAADWIKENHGINADSGHIRGACNGKHDVIYGYKWSYDDIFSGEWNYSPMQRVVHCSNGMKFQSVTDAAKWVRESGIGNCSASSISRACSREEATAYGFSWWYEGEDIKSPSNTIEVIRRKVSKPVLRSDGMEFKSAKEAADYMRTQGWNNACASGICRVVRKRGKSAYGYGWEYLNEQNTTSKPVG